MEIQTGKTTYSIICVNKLSQLILLKSGSMFYILCQNARSFIFNIILGEATDCTKSLIMLASQPYDMKLKGTYNYMWKELNIYLICRIVVELAEELHSLLILHSCQDDFQNTACIDTHTTRWVTYMYSSDNWCYCNMQQATGRRGTTCAPHHTSIFDAIDWLMWVNIWLRYVCRTCTSFG